MISPTQFHIFGSNGMSLQQFKCLIQSPKCKHLPFLSCCYCCFWKLPQVCANLLYNCKHPPPTFLKGGNLAFHLLICRLRKSTFVHNCSLWFYSGKWWQIWWRSVVLWQCTVCWKLHTWQLFPNSRWCLGKGPAQGPAGQHPKAHWCVIGTHVRTENLGLAHYSHSREPGKVFWVGGFCFVL